MVCLLCGGAAAYEISQIIVAYREGSIATKIRFTSVTTVQYSTLLLCPTKWVSKKKVSDFHVEEDVVTYLFSIFQPILPVIGRKFQNGKLSEKIKSAMEKTQYTVIE